MLVWGRHGRDGLPDRGSSGSWTPCPSRLLVEIEDCGHCPQIEAPERLTELLMDFPASLARARLVTWFSSSSSSAG